MHRTRLEQATSQLPDIIRNYLDDCTRNKHIELPMLAQVVSEVMEMCDSKETNAEQISEVLHRDQALAGHVLGVANSPLCRAWDPITSLQEAVSRLGLQQIVEIALMVSVQARVFRSERHLDLVKTYWRHSVATGCFAKEIAKYRQRDAESTFLCGLLYNVGKPVVLDALTTFEEMNGREVPDKDVIVAVDEYYVRMGTLLAREWNLPASVIESIEYHDEYWEATFEDVAMTVNLASHLAVRLIEDPDDFLFLDVDEFARLSSAKDLGIDTEGLESLVTQLDHILAIVEAIK